MGRTTGWLTASSCVLRANGEPAPHLIYVPEAYPDGLPTEKFLSDVENMMKRYRAVTVAVSEGIIPDTYTADKDAEESGVARHLEKCCAEHFGCKVRSIELSVMQRCSSHIASATDIEESERVGRAAVDAALAGESGKMMGFRRISSEPYRVEVISTDVATTANRERFLPENWICGEANDISTDAIGYFLPLIQGEVEPEYRNGIPIHFRLNQ